MTRFFTSRIRALPRLAACALALCMAASVAGAAPDPYVAANAAAARGDHAQAAAAFERSIAEDGWSVNTLLGLGNAYASSGELGRAILAFERARVLAPRDPAIATNLARARESAGVAAPPVTRIDRAVGMLASDRWAWIALAGFALACAGVAFAAWSPRRRAAWSVTVVGALVAAGAVGAARQAAPDPRAAVVLATEPARIAPFAAAEPAFTVPAGETVHVEQRRGEHVYVRLDAERAGWLPAAAIERLVPTDRRAFGA